MNNQKGVRAYTSKTIARVLSKVSPEEQKRTENKMLLAAKIDDGRKAKGWSQTEFAEQMGKQPSEISKWLSGTHNFTSDTLFDIGDKLGIELVSVKEKELRVIKVVEYKIVVSSPAHPRYAGLHESGISQLFHQQPSLA
jgi:transcriptional regulator with XRE-family HTH domain